MKPDTRSDFDAQLARSSPRPERMSPEEKARQEKRHRALVAEWRKDPEWAAAEKQLGDERFYLSASGFGKLAGNVSGSTVHRWHRAGKVVGVPYRGHGYRYPRDQLDDTNQLPEGLGQVIAELGHGNFIWVWLTTPHAGLRATAPLDALKSGRMDRVLAVASSDASGAFS